MGSSKCRPLAGCALAVVLLAGAVQIAPSARAEQVASASTEQLLRAAIASPNRSEKARDRDRYRHPLETLTFLGLRPEMTVIELWPGGGWYTALLAPVLAERGKLIVTSFDPNGPKDSELTAMARSLNTKLASDPKTFGRVQTVVIAPPTNLTLGADSSADMVLTFRNIHNWAAENYDDKVFAAAFKVLKSGGIFGVEEHRARAGVPEAASVRSGYMPEDYVIKKVEAAGFKFVAKSEINANPKDTKDYPGGVWSLPPTLTLGEKNRDKYLAIGESDRMTLKFVKP
ncbi:class I SAM-dependent methyltransferase [Gloeobacter kilaueensis]|uniref:Methyltransferase n=1 Tax=Gloeobacter kilaueensis (strain ATCC BAA-2537 / CCAP 1431/1 / ULC 316 / JS1) TaxID=1183438 RepID=U5QM58_GLOK1|nr:class I SAM-dependent methyltransferase [Gloeobacter kilaueensis]AGY59958.1 methyltransferase [Gloeobacter kilaueensis JS1]